MTDNKTSERVLTDLEIEEINATIIQLQKDISLIENDVKEQEFNNALKNIIVSMNHTECPVCKEKLLSLSVDIIKAKTSCNNNDGKCDILIESAIEKAFSIKNEFIPIATEKRYVRDKQTNDSNDITIKDGIIKIPSAKDIINNITSK